MEVYEDFEFYCPLTVADALERLQKGDAFFGEVNGNHFHLQHNDGTSTDASLYPIVSGYVLREGTGSRVFARAQVSPLQEYNAKFGLGASIAAVLLFAYVFWDDQGNEMPYTPDESHRLSQILMYAVILIGTPIYGWRNLKKFKKSLKYATIGKFIDYMGAGMDSMESLQPLPASKNTIP